MKYFENKLVLTEQKLLFMKRVIVLFFVVFISACATTEGYKERLDTWLGIDEERLINGWGTPDSFYESGGQRYLTYIESVSGYMPGTSPTYQTQIIGNTAYTTSIGGSPGYSYRFFCKTTFTVRNGVVTNWSFEGNNCKALPIDNIWDNLRNKSIANKQEEERQKEREREFEKEKNKMEREEIDEKVRRLTESLYKEGGHESHAKGKTP